LIDCVRRLLPEKSGDAMPLEINASLSLGALVDIVSYWLNFGVSAKVDLLAEWNVDERAGRLVQHMQGMAEGALPPGTRFPPDFSQN
jgi:hypothetical protein